MSLKTLDVGLFMGSHGWDATSHTHIHTGDSYSVQSVYQYVLSRWEKTGFCGKDPLHPSTYTLIP